MSEPDLARVVDSLYAAALDPELWPEALERIGAAVGARGTVIVPFDPNRTASTIASASLEGANADYQAEWWRHDTRIAKARTLGLKPGAVTTDALYFPPEETRHDPFFQDFLARHGLGDHAAFLMRDPAGGIVSVTAQRDLRDGAYEAAEVERFARLAPHIARAFTLGGAIWEARRRVSDLELAFERLRFGVVVLDHAGLATHVNETARGFLGRGLQIGPDRQPRATETGERSRLAALIASVLPGGDASVATPLLLKRGDGLTPIYVEAVPVRRSDPFMAITGSSAGGALLVVRDVFSDRGSVLPQLRQLGLTPAEARSAELIGRGRSPREASDALNIAEGTVRVNLRTAYAKLGLSRQSELAVLVARLEQVAAD